MDPILTLVTFCQYTGLFGCPGEWQKAKLGELGVSSLPRGMGEGGTCGAMPTSLPTLVLWEGLRVSWSEAHARPPTCNSDEGGGVGHCSDVCCASGWEMRRKQLPNWKASAISRTREGAWADQTLKYSQVQVWGSSLARLHSYRELPAGLGW